MTKPFMRALSVVASLRRCRRGATAIEYGLIVSLVVVVAMVGVGTLGGGAGQMWGGIRNKIVAIEP